MYSNLFVADRANVIVCQALRAALAGALMLAGLARGRTDFVAGSELAPIYLREANFIKAPPPRNL